MVPGRALRRSYGEDFAAPVEEQEGGFHRRRKAGLRLTFPGGLPRSAWGRIAAGITVLLVAGVLVGAGLLVERWVLHDRRFFLAGTSSIDVEGNAHMTRGQLLGVFGGDVERNIFQVPLGERQAELEEMSWVKRATVMRLLPNHLRVQITERTPVAFVRNASHVGLVDAGGELLDAPVDGAEMTQYSFPVVTGILPGDPISTREARIKIYEGFIADLDASGEKITGKLSEVDLSNPEDVKALIPDNGTEVLVHFGDGNFLDRYRKYEEHLPEWRTQYPKLASVDMRYERQVVLEMQPGSAVPVSGSAEAEAEMTGRKKVAGTALGAKSAGGVKAVPKPVSAGGMRGEAKAVHVVTVKPAVHSAVGKGKPQLLGSWTSDGKYHPPPGVRP